MRVRTAGLSENLIFPILFKWNKSQMNKLLAITLLALAASAFAKDKPDVTYVGGGRYTCSGKSAQCAQIDANNRAIEAQQRAKDDMADTTLEESR